MGKYNSSIYRVRPLMKIIEQDYDAFLKLVSLVGLSTLGIPHCCRYDGENCTEIQLKPTKKHLSALIRRMATKKHGGISVKGKNRNDLFFGDKKTRAEACERAKKELDAKYDSLTSGSRAWFVFEGFTNPDIFIEGEDYVIVCEGKWTESHITTTTTYLSSEEEYRNQMIRHIQGALNYTSKKVCAFYIVDSGCGYKEELSKESFKAQLDLETIELDPIEKARILDSFYGYTTWQDIKEALPAVTFKQKEEII